MGRGGGGGWNLNNLIFKVWGGGFWGFELIDMLFYSGDNFIDLYLYSGEILFIFFFFSLVISWKCFSYGEIIIFEWKGRIDFLKVKIFY